jgi:hypothetical protein
VTVSLSRRTLLHGVNDDDDDDDDVKHGKAKYYPAHVSYT